MKGDVIIKFVFYKPTQKHNVGDILEGYIKFEKDGEKRYMIFVEKHHDSESWISYPESYPIMPLSEWREQQINSILYE